MKPMVPLLLALFVIVSGAVSAAAVVEMHCVTGNHVLVWNVMA